MILLQQHERMKRNINRTKTTKKMSLTILIFPWIELFLGFHIPICSCPHVQFSFHCNQGQDIINCSM